MEYEYTSYSFIYPSNGVDVTEFVSDEEAWEYLIDSDFAD